MSPMSAASCSIAAWSVRSTVAPRAFSGNWASARATLDSCRETTMGMAARSPAADATPKPMPEVPPMTRTRALFRLTDLPY